MAYNFVLVHGAWHGGWCWRRVADRLRAGGHLVFTPTLTGRGERSHLLRPDLDLDVHIADVINMIKWERLSDVVLWGTPTADSLFRGSPNGSRTSFARSCS